MRLTTIITTLILASAAIPADAQSLWQKGKTTQNRQYHSSLLSDNRAMTVGDVVTIVINEQQQVLNNENVKTEKSSQIAADGATFQPEQQIVDELLPINWDVQRDFEGKANFNKQGSFSTRISASVIDVHPNGNLVVQGRRKVVIDGEEKWMTVSGVVRAFDVDSSNNVASHLVANATVTYKSSGRLAQNTKRGWLDSFLDYVWPF